MLAVFKPLRKETSCENESATRVFRESIREQFWKQRIDINTMAAKNNRETFIFPHTLLSPYLDCPKGEMSEIQLIVAQPSQFEIRGTVPLGDH